MNGSHEVLLSLGTFSLPVAKAAVGGDWMPITPESAIVATESDRDW
jgi:hypothetical protein